MRSWILRQAGRLAILLLVAVVAGLGLRAFNAQRGPPLEAWHTFVPDDLRAEAIDKTDWQGYLAAEDDLFRAVRAKVMHKPAEGEPSEISRYIDGGLIDPARFATDWNRSYLLEPDGPPKGAVVLLHGLTDSPYSLRHIARLYRDRGFVAIGIRLPGHGTVPAALTKAEWQDWAAATRLAMREARRRAGEAAPIHIVGFSNGGALAMIYELEALGDPGLPRADRLILVSPMIGITRFARFAGIAGWPAFFPAFAKAAWLAVLPEFNPFKYNSFPVNGARQSYQLTQELRARILAAERDGRLAALPPVLTFQSVLDFTVNTRAIVTTLYDRLPANGSEIVLFDINRSAKLGPLFNRTSRTMLDRLLPPAPRSFTATIVANVEPNRSEVVARTTPAGRTEAEERPLGVDYPPGVFSLSHVALPFPPWDSLYGISPDSAEDFGIHLGNVAARGERGALIVHLDSLLRMSSNPFYRYIGARIDEAITAPASAAIGNARPAALPPPDPDEDPAVQQWLEDEAAADEPW